MATVNYSVPDGVKKAFDRAFANENKSAVVALLLRKAVEDRELGKRRSRAVAALLDLRGRIRPVSPAALRKARRASRP